MMISKGGKSKLIFDQIVRTTTGFVGGVKMEQTQNTVGEQAMAILNEGRRVPRMEFHGQLGHVGTQVQNYTAKMMGIKLVGKADTCEDCALAKARQKNLAKENPNKTNVPGLQIYMDQSKVKGTSIGGKSNWLLLVDEATGFGPSF